MGIPGDTYFGEGLDGKGIDYGQVRTIKDDQTKLELLKKRIDGLLIRQVDELSKKNEDGTLTIWSPFPLSVLTLLAIETIGHVIGDIEKIKNENEYEQSKIIVTPIYQILDIKLSHKPTKNFYEGFEKIHGTPDKKSIKKYSDIIHKYQRNTFNHGYQAKGVYLDHELPDAWTIKEREGFMIINPYLFWNRFKMAYESIFQDILSGQKRDWRQNALKYFDRLLC